MRSASLPVAVGLAYFVAGRAALLLAIPPGYATAVWPAAGIALAAVAVYGRGVLPGVFVGSVAVNLSNGFDPAAMLDGAGVAVAIGLGAVAQAWFGATLFGKLCKYPGTLDEERDPVNFATIVTPVGCLVNPTVGVVALLQAGLVPGAEAGFHWATWWVGDAIGVLVATPLTLVLIGQPRAQWRSRALPVALPLILVLGVAVGAYVAVSAVEQDRIEQEYRREVGTVAERLDRQRADVLETLESVRGLFEASGEVTETTFLHFTARLLAANPSIQALSWNPVVAQGDRAAHEEAARARGHTGYRVTERDPQGALIVARPREHHVPVTYIQPVMGNEAALGFDVASDRDRRDALELAARTGAIAATAALDLVQGPSRERGALFVAPVRSGGDLRGYVVGVFRLAPLLRTVVPTTSGSVIELRDATGDELLSSAGGEPGPSPMAWSREFDVGGRIWVLTFRPTPEWLATHRSWQPWALLASSLLLAGLLGVLLLTTVGRAERVRALVRERTASLEEARAEAEDAGSARALFLATMSHEIRTPLTAVLGMTDLLLQSDLDGDEQVYASSVRDAGRDLLAVVNDILDFSKIDAGRLELEEEPFDVTRIVRDETRMFGAQATAKGLALVSEVDPGLPPRVVGDPTRLRQVLSNLLSNAIKFTLEGTVTIRVRQLRRSGGIAAILFEVQDTGVGIPPEVVGRLFDPFTQAGSDTTRRYGGTGLGLAISHRLTALMGGALAVSSTVGQGSRFHFELELPWTDRGDSISEVLVPTDRLDGMRVLVVDDNELNRLLARKLLERVGAIIEEEVDGDDAVARLGIEQFDAVLMDWQMPTMDGLAASRAIRAREADLQWRRTPIIGVSARALAGDRATCLEAGMDEYIVKPFQREHLIDVLVDVVHGGDGIQMSGDFDLSPASTLDTHAVADLRLLEEHQPGLLRDTLDLFARTLADDLASMEVAVSEGDGNRLLQAAHHLKSAAGAVGAARLLRRAERVCRLARTRDLTGVEELVEAVRTAGEEVTEALDDLA